MTENQEHKPQEILIAQSDNSSTNPDGQQNAPLPVEDKVMVEAFYEAEGKINGFLKAIGDEASKLSEFVAQERRLTSELCGILTQILKTLKISFNISADCLPRLEARQIKLSKEGYLIVKRDGDKTDSKPLRDYSTEIILEVMLVIVPELENAVKAYRKSICQRVNILEKIKRELLNLQKVLSPEERGSVEQLHQEEIRSLQVITPGQS